MPRQNWMAEVLLPGSSKTRKRGCSTSSSSSSILIRKPRGSRSTTPAPTWRMTPLRVPRKSPKYAQSLGNAALRSKPVSARKLAATLWEMNEIPSPSVTVRGSLSGKKLPMKKEMKLREKIGSTTAAAAWSVHSGSLPPHLSDPSHSPASEKMDRSGTGSRFRKTPSVSHRVRIAESNLGIIDSLSSASLMEVETRSRQQTTTGSTTGTRTTHLKDVSNALTTSKELLKIIHRVSSHDKQQPSTSNSLVSALHAELERSRLLVNQLISEQRSDQNEVNYLMKCLSEEKSSRKNKEHHAVKAAIESIAEELEIERKLRRRSESLTKKLARELNETKATLLKTAKELENEKRTREIMEEMCEDLASIHETKNVRQKSRPVPNQNEESGESSGSELVNDNISIKSYNPLYIKERKSHSSKEYHKMASFVQRNALDGVEFGDMNGEVLNDPRHSSYTTETKGVGQRRRSCGDKLGKGTTMPTRRDQVLLNASLLGSSKPIHRLSQDGGSVQDKGRGYFPRLINGQVEARRSNRREFGQ
ncbi:uncharacterized protein At5g41620-like [Impatiens glandulifera]|uniref:uncharacterized protein At5g41620-like n=1 Tax=Impatiens glandulifera TaxID=253017 RepID=UPI001FB0B466|nr:uncharacterized protein At5g41620-like [Impatiens glandulifera]